MGEKFVPPRENGAPKKEETSQNGGMEVDDVGDEEIGENISPEEFAQLDSQLDALNSALDDIEQKNDDIHSQLLQLLNANREIRQQLQQSSVVPEESKQ